MAGERIPAAGKTLPLTVRNTFIEEVSAEFPCGSRRSSCPASPVAKVLLSLTMAPSFALEDEEDMERSISEEEWRHLSTAERWAEPEQVLTPMSAEFLCGFGEIDDDAEWGDAISKDVSMCSTMAPSLALEEEEDGESSISEDEWEHLSTVQDWPEPEQVVTPMSRLSMWSPAAPSFALELGEEERRSSIADAQGMWSHEKHSSIEQALCQPCQPLSLVGQVARSPLSANAKAWKPNARETTKGGQVDLEPLRDAFQSETVSLVAELVEAARESKFCISAEACWRGASAGHRSCTVVAKVKPEHARIIDLLCSEVEEFIWESACEERSVRLLGAMRGPFMPIPQGFVVMLGNEVAEGNGCACGNMYNGGFCTFKKCKYQHPTSTVTLTFIAEVGH